MSKRRIRFLLTLSGTIIMMMSWIILLYTFLSAYMAPSKIVIVHINNIGEANIELVFLMLSVPCIIHYLSNFGWSSKKETVWFEGLEREDKLGV